MRLPPWTRTSRHFDKLDEANTTEKKLESESPQPAGMSMVAWRGPLLVSSGESMALIAESSRRVLNNGRNFAAAGGADGL